MAVARTGFVSLDCDDPLALGEFWAAMLGGEIKFTSPTTVGVRTDWVWLAALKVPDYVAPTWPDGDVPKQIHLDLAVTELDAAVAAAERLGARVAPVQPAPDRWRVLLDPAGHPFCLTTQIPPEAR
jgi:Glyoxalase-like domain